MDNFADGHLAIILFLFSRLVRTQRGADKRIWTVKIGMKKKRGNPSWGKPDFHSTARIQANSFEEIVRKLRLSPEQYVNSVQLKDWVRKNKDQKYVPSDLLKAWDFETV
jgi:hypothetical protein